MTNDGEARVIDRSIEVPGTPDEVWRAIATGPGITSWYVPHTVEEREGGAAAASFGPGPEMLVPGRVAAWEPTSRIVFDGGQDGVGLAFEWTIEVRDNGTCIVRLVNSGFGSGEEWDNEYNGMSDGWPLFLLNLRLHLEHFPGRTATPMLPMAMWPGERDHAWVDLLNRLGLPSAIEVGAHVETAGDAPGFGGVVVEVGPRRVALLLDSPAEGTGFLAAEGPAGAPASGVSVWSYFYGDESAAIAAREEAKWSAWLGQFVANGDSVVVPS